MFNNYWPDRMVQAVFLFVLLASPSMAGDIQSMFRSPAWRLAYELEFNSDSTRQRDDGSGPYSIHTTLQTSFKASKLLDQRNEGPNIGTLKMNLALSQGGAAPLDTAKYMQAMNESYDSTANWVYSGGALTELDEDASYEELAEAVQAINRSQAAPMHVRYEEVRTGRGLSNEMGALFDLDSHTTADGTAEVVPAGDGLSNVILDIDTRTGRYMLVLPVTVSNPDQARLQFAKSSRTSFSGDDPSEFEAIEEKDFATFPQIAITDPAFLLGDMPLIEGEVGSGSDIHGEFSIAAEFTDDGARLPGTLTIRFTATPVSL